ncbi:MAG: hypothetical protein HC862_07010 [Scytonema sp. RU_4_4]|nr:hypothetical protein [Scytonema sp. RU_4_4]NJR76423.1 hypothetical protein [Scytonema sp. CRU_2_7]
MASWMGSIPNVQITRRLEVWTPGATLWKAALRASTSRETHFRALARLYKQSRD